MNTATLIKTLPPYNNPARIRQLYRLDPAFNGHELVLVSTIYRRQLQETALFPSDMDGKITRFKDLVKPFPTATAQEALNHLGYEIQ